MYWRFTSRLADEAVCLAILFGFSRDQIEFLHRLPHDPDERMRHFLLMQRYLPPELIFWEPNNLSFDGLTWAPSTFLSRTGGNFSAYFKDEILNENFDGAADHKCSSGEEAFVDHHGFHVQYPGLIINFEGFNEKGNKRLDCFVEDVSAHYIAFLHGNTKIREPTWDMFCGLKSPMIILPLEPSSSFPIVANNAKFGVLVECNNSIGDELYCSFQIRILCVGLSWHLKSIDEAQNLAKSQVITAKSVQNQKWCIS
jgi:hypothetical protein